MTKVKWGDWGKGGFQPKRKPKKYRNSEREGNDSHSRYKEERRMKRETEYED